MPESSSLVGEYPRSQRGRSFPLSQLLSSSEAAARPYSMQLGIVGAGLGMGLVEAGPELVASSHWLVVVVIGVQLGTMGQYVG